MHKYTKTEYKDIYIHTYICIYTYKDKTILNICKLSYIWRERERDNIKGAEIEHLIAMN